MIQIILTNQNQTQVFKFT